MRIVFFYFFRETVETMSVFSNTSLIQSCEIMSEIICNNTVFVRCENSRKLRFIDRPLRDSNLKSIERLINICLEKLISQSYDFPSACYIGDSIRERSMRVRDGEWILEHAGKNFACPTLPAYFYAFSVSKKDSNKRLI